MILLSFENRLLEQGVPQHRRRINFREYVFTVRADIHAPTFELGQRRMADLMQCVNGRRDAIDRATYEGMQRRPIPEGNSRFAKEMRHGLLVGFALHALTCEDLNLERGPSRICPGDMVRLAQEIVLIAPELIFCENSVQSLIDDLAPPSVTPPPRGTRQTSVVYLFGNPALN